MKTLAMIVEEVFENHFDRYCRECPHLTHYVEMHGFTYGPGEDIFECNILEGKVRDYTLCPGVEEITSKEDKDDDGE